MAPSKFRDLVLQSAERMVMHFPSNQSVKETHVMKPHKIGSGKKREASRVPETGKLAKRPRTRADQRQQLELDQVIRAIPMPMNDSDGIYHKSGGDEVTIEVLYEKHEFETDLPMPKSNSESTGFPFVTAITTDPNLVPGGVDKEPESSDDPFDDSGSVFEEFLEPPADILQVTSPLPAISAAFHSMTTPEKTGILRGVKENLEMSQLSPSQTLSPLSAKVSHGSSPIKPFIRQLPSSKVPEMSINLPWLKADHQIITCFRTAEVVRIQSQPQLIAANNERGDTIELYARIKSTVHQDAGRIVQFADLFFPSRPPYLIGACMTDEASAAVARIMSTSASRKAPFTQSSQSTEYGSVYELCRAIIRTKPGSKEVSIQSVKETSWEEVEHVRGIVEPDYQLI